MTQQDKDLLLCDLSARLPYGVKVHIKGEYHNYHQIEEIDVRDEVVRYFENMHLCEEKVCDCKPYLRPMSSMTKEELNKLNEYMRIYSYNISHKLSVFYKAQDYLNSIHVDHRGLIEKGLALEAKEGMYNL